MSQKSSSPGNDTIVYTWPGAPAKVLMPNGRWMYLVGPDPVSKDDYKKACAQQLEGKGGTYALKAPDAKSREPEPTRISIWKSGDASFWVEGQRVKMEEFITHFVPEYESGQDVILNDKRFRITHISPKYSTYSVDGVNGTKKAFIGALAAALFPGKVDVCMETDA